MVLEPKTSATEVYDSIRITPTVRHRSLRKKPLLPTLIWIVLISIVLTLLFGDRKIGGYTIKGYAWLFPMFFAVLLIMSKGIRDITILKIWSPWIFVITIYQLVNPNPLLSLQYSLMLLCPIVVGFAVSNISISENHITIFLEILEYIAGLFLVTICVKTGLLLTGKLQSHGSSAADVMMASLLCSIFAAQYAMGNKRALIWWVISAAIPIIALTRMAIAVALSTIPLSFAPIKFKFRAMLTIAICAFAITLFYTDRVQQRMFYSGHGSIEDLFWDNPDLKTNARKYMWKSMDQEIKEKPLLGHGSGASRMFILSITEGTLEHPHNDWRRFLYDFGLIGTVVFVMCAVYQMLHLVARRRRAKNKGYQVILLGGSSSLICTLFFMNSDNVVLYAAFFGNLQFTIFGLVYSFLRCSGYNRKANKAKKASLFIQYQLGFLKKSIYGQWRTPE